MPSLRTVTPDAGDALRVVRVACVALVDAAPLVAAQHLGLFEKEGVRVQLSREVGWAGVREKLALGQVDAAHAPAAMVLSMDDRADGEPVALPFLFNANGNAITLANDLYRRGVRDAASLRQLVRSTPHRLFTFAVVARHSSHHILLRTWLRSGGIEPDSHVRIMVLPPSQMPGCLRDGLIDGYCAGEPWNSVAVADGVGWIPATSEDIAPGHPEKALIVSGPLCGDRATLRKIVAALGASCAFCDTHAGRARLPAMMEAAFGDALPVSLLACSLTGPFETGLGPRSAERFHLFRAAGNRPAQAQAAWLIDGMVATGIVPPESRETLMRRAAQRWGEPGPPQAPRRVRRAASSRA
jgi:NitT/TauT family transport system ATP-binding protein